jgi:integrative and conjugative element protein (TIGR02256 family)
MVSPESRDSTGFRMAMHEYRSQDRRFGLRFAPEHLERLLTLAAAAVPNETGGIIVGRYSDELDLAIATELSGPPSDSRAGRTWFERGFKGLRKWLNSLWSSKTYYLGEWHFHPNGAPDPSGVDRKEIKTISTSQDYHCKVPVLLILGGAPNDTWSIKVFVCPQGGELIECHPVS